MCAIALLPLEPSLGVYPTKSLMVLLGIPMWGNLLAWYYVATTTPIARDRGEDIFFTTETYIPHFFIFWFLLYVFASCVHQDPENVPKYRRFKMRSEEDDDDLATSKPVFAADL